MKKIILSLRFLTSGFARTAFVLCALSIGANAAPRDLDENGLYKEPVCGAAARVINSITVIAQEDQTGIKGSNNKWDMEIYAHKSGASWTLVGKDKTPDANPRNLCRIASGVNTPFTEQLWFKKWFKPESAAGTK
jgi:hypothetical protein